jgi:hypothetical protein
MQFHIVVVGSTGEDPKLRQLVGRGWQEIE